MQLIFQMLPDILIKPCCCRVTGWLTGSERVDSGACCGIDPEKGVSNGQLRLHTQALIIYASSDWHTHTHNTTMHTAPSRGKDGVGYALSRMWPQNLSEAKVDPCPCFHVHHSSLQLRSRKNYFFVIADTNQYSFITNIQCIPQVFQPKIKVKHKQHLKLCAYVNEIKHKDRHKNTFSSWKDCWLCFSTQQTTGARTQATSEARRTENKGHAVQTDTRSDVNTNASCPACRWNCRSEKEIQKQSKHCVDTILSESNSHWPLKRHQSRVDVQESVIALPVVWRCVCVCEGVKWCEH